MKFLIVLPILGLLVGCTSFDRSSSSGYANYSGDAAEVSLNQAAPSTNFSTRTMSNSESESYRLAMFRKNLEESKVRTSEEKSHYLRYRPHLSELERIQYLELDDIYSRERWIQNQGLSSAPQRHSRSVASLIEQNDIAIGMKKEDVRESWGDPDIVEVAGNPRLENERWKFSIPITTPEGYQVEERVIYFETGRVVGWQAR